MDVRVPGSVSVVIEFKDDGRYFMYANGVVSDSGSYSIVNEKTRFATENKDVIHMSTLHPLSSVIFELTGTRLVVHDNATDSYVSTYARVLHD